MIDRVFEYIEYKGFSVSEFSRAIDVSNGYLAKQKAGNANIGSQIIEKIVRGYPDINVEWLITGEGTMIKPENKTSKLIEENKDFINNYLWGGLGSYDKRQILYYEYYNLAQLRKIKEESLREVEEVYNNNKNTVSILLSSIKQNKHLDSTYYTNKYKEYPLFDDYIGKIYSEIDENIEEAGGLENENLKLILYILYLEEEKRHWDNMLTIVLGHLFSQLRFLNIARIE